MILYRTYRYKCNGKELPIQFRFDYITGIVEMLVDDNVAEANGYYNLDHLKAEIHKTMPAVEIPEWVRIDNCGSPALAAFGLN